MKIPRAENNVSQEIIGERVSLLNSMGVDLSHTTHYSIDPQTTTGNIENFIGVAQVPVGLAGPLLINGECARGEFLVPLATTEGALVASYSRGMKAITESGGCSTYIRSDFFTRVGAFSLPNVSAAVALARWCEEHTHEIAQEVEATTQHGHFQQMFTHVVGTRLYVEFRITTGDAMGSNMCSNAAEMACRWIEREALDTNGTYLWLIAEDKKLVGRSMTNGKGKSVVAEALIMESVLERVLHTHAEDTIKTFESTDEWWTIFGAHGHNSHVANGLVALYIACGQDAAYVAESCSGHLRISLQPNRGIHVAISLPCMIVGTVGGGCGLPTQRECLRVLGCEGEGNARKFAEVAAATALAGELSVMAAVAAGEFVRAHNQLGRNRPA
ncbi:MAG: hydroxymethylglutaryl-CoA reductase [Chloroflexota bacterium]|nr:hydroxymethylglutaryl-CoA reductase [Chloroflexota bacterium]